jgi:hypothetical protein
MKLGGLVQSIDCSGFSEGVSGTPVKNRDVEAKSFRGVVHLPENLVGEVNESHRYVGAVQF